MSTPQNGPIGPSTIPARAPNNWPKIQRIKEKILQNVEGAEQSEFIAELLVLTKQQARIDDLLFDLELHLNAHPFNPDGEPNE